MQGGNNPGYGRGKSQRKNFNRQGNKDKNADSSQAHHKDRNAGGRRGGQAAGADQADFKYRPIKEGAQKEGDYENTKEDEFQQHPSGGNRKKHQQQYDGMAFHSQSQSNNQHHGGKHSQNYKNQHSQMDHMGPGGVSGSDMNVGGSTGQYSNPNQIHPAPGGMH